MSYLPRTLILLPICLMAIIGIAGCRSVRAPHAGSGAAPSGDVEPTGWWRELGGRSLDAMVDEAFERSPSIEVLAARVEVAKADARLLRAAQVPSVGALGGARFGERQEFETGNQRADVMRYAGAASFAWEVDFWGRVRQLREAGRRKVEAAGADEAAGHLLLVSEIARIEISRRRLAAEEGVIAAVLAANDETVERLREKAEAGITDENLADRQAAEGDRLRREIEELRRQRRLAELALDRLLGRDPGYGDWDEPRTMPRLPKLPEVVETEVLSRRPDLRAAGARVSEAWHLSEAASRDLLPKLQFTGLASGRSMQLSPSIDQWVAQVAPTLEVPLWDPVRRAQAERSSAQARLAAAEYRDAVLRALEETAAALTNLGAQAKIRRSAERSAESLTAVFERTREKFAAGVVSQLEVLEDQRRSLDAERAALRAREAQLAAWIDLKKATGG